MKNTINALAQQHLGEEIERFALTLGKHFLTRSHETLATLRDKTPLLKTYSLREGETDSFGAICGGEVTVLVEPQNLNEAIFLIGAGHCSHAIAKLCADCGLFVTVVDDRSELTKDLPANVSAVALTNPAEFIRNREWQSDEALVIVSRNYEIDRDALAAALAIQGVGYIGMIGSRRKVRRVFDQLKEGGISDELLAQVYAPSGSTLAPILRQKLRSAYWLKFWSS